MKIRYLIISILIFCGFESISQDLTCADFKTGKFYRKSSKKNEKTKIIGDGKMEEYELNLYPKNKIYYMTRAGNSQLQWKNKKGEGSPEYHTIEWIDDCTYRLTYDISKNEMDKHKKYVNDNNGIVFFKIGIKGKCMTYEGVMTMNEGYQTSQIVVICKE